MRFCALIPELSVRDLDRSKGFYVDLLGFRVEYGRAEDKFLFLSLGEAQIMLEEVNGHWETGVLDYPLGRGVNFQISVDDLEPILCRLKQACVPLFREPRVSSYRVGDEFVREREFLVQDPDGYLLRFSQEMP